MKNRYPMKKIVCSLLFVFAITQLNAQDLVITAEGDTLNCYVNPQKTGNRYKIAIRSGKELKWVKWKKDQVIKVERGFYIDNPAVTQEYLANYSFPHLSISTDFGYGFKCANLEPTDNSGYSFVEGLYNGLVTNFDVTYFNSENWGFGLAYYGYFASGSSTTYYNSSSSSPGHRSSSNLKLSLHSFLPMVTYRALSKNKHNAFYLKYGLGFVYYNGGLSDSHNEIGLASSLSVGYDWGVSKSTALGLKLSLVAGGLKANDHHHSFTENVSYVALTAGVRFLSH